MKRIIILILLAFLFSLAPVSAHPGNTAGDGCHYCRTNCDRWGVEWDERHCHNGGSNPPPVQVQEVFPTNIPIPLPTRRPTLRPTKIPTPTKRILKKKATKKVLKKKVRATPTPKPSDK